MLIDPGHRFLLSPPAVSLIPILVLHLAIFVYLCRVKEKSVATHWLNGWLASVMAGDLFMFLGGSVYGVLGGCLEMGSLVFFYISIVPSLQFAYHFPRPAFGREARRVLVFSAAFVAVCLGWLVIELLAYPSEYLYSFEQYFISTRSGWIPACWRSRSRPLMRFTRCHWGGCGSSGCAKRFT